MTAPAAAGRAGRLRLKHRLATAGRASELLDRKWRIVAAELDRLGLLANRTREEWENSARTAVTWQRRADALDGQRALAAAAPRSLATVAVVYGGAMGLRHPVHATVTYPDDPVRAGSSALAFATTAHQQALQAAVRHAAMARAVAVLTAELAATRARQRAIDSRWIPRLEGALHALEVQLDELDREENVRLRWAADLVAKGERR